MNFWAEYYVGHEQMTDRRQEAASYRLIRRARSSARDRTTIFSQMMTSAGRRLITWGHRLEAH